MPVKAGRGGCVCDPNPTCRIYFHVFLWRNHKNMNNVFCLIHPVYDMDTYIFEDNVFTKQAKHE